MDIKSNYIPRDSIFGYELTKKEREYFDYYTDEELDSHQFIRYKKELYDVSEFTRMESDPYWDGSFPTGFFHGILIKIVGDRFIVGDYYC